MQPIYEIAPAVQPQQSLPNAHETQTLKSTYFVSIYTDQLAELNAIQEFPPVGSYLALLESKMQQCDVAKAHDMHVHGCFAGTRA